MKRGAELVGPNRHVDKVPQRIPEGCAGGKAELCQFLRHKIGMFGIDLRQNGEKQSTPFAVLTFDEAERAPQNSRIALVT